MNYKKYDMGKYNLHIIKTDKFKTITLKINFKRKVKKEDITIRRLLTQTLLQSSLKYPSRRSLEMEIEDLYAATIHGEAFMSGNYDIMTFSEVFLNEKYTEPGMNKRSLDFLFQLILNPNVKNDSFDDYGFDLAKRLVKDEINSFSDYPASYSVARMLENMNKKSPVAYRNCGYLKDLKKINESSLYEYYKDVICNDIVDIVIVGDIDEEQTKEMFEQNFSKINSNKVSESHFIINNKIRKSPLVIKEKQNIKQSRLILGCNFEELSNFELRYVLNVLSFILGGSGDSLLFQVVREKNSLCYNISSSYNITSGLLIISAGIDGKNYEKTVKLINEQIDLIKKGEFEDTEIDKAKVIFKNSCIEITDSPNSIINTYLSHEYLNSDLIEEKYKNIELVTKDMVVELAKKMHVNTIYMLEGASDED